MNNFIDEVHDKELHENIESLLNKYLLNVEVNSEFIVAIERACYSYVHDMQSLNEYKATSQKQRKETYLDDLDKMLDHLIEFNSLYADNTLLSHGHKHEISKKILGLHTLLCEARKSAVEERIEATKSIIDNNQDLINSIGNLESEALYLLIEDVNQKNERLDKIHHKNRKIGNPSEIKECLLVEIAQAYLFYTGRKDLYKKPKLGDRYNPFPKLARLCLDSMDDIIGLEKTKKSTFDALITELNRKDYL